MSVAMQVDQVVDARGQMCPMPVLALAKAIKAMQPGQILSISATDQGARRDIPAWAEKTGNRLLQMTEEHGVMAFYVQKAG